MREPSRQLVVLILGGPKRGAGSQASVVSKAERTRERIIKAAAEAVRAVGPGGVSVSDVMTRLDLTHGGFYAHFASKDDLIAAAIQEAFRDIAERRRAMTDGKPPEIALAACIDWYVSSEMRDFPEKACPLTTLTQETRRLPQSAQDRMAAGAARMVECLAELLRAFGHANPDCEALAMAASMIGAVSLARTVVDPDQSEDILSATRKSLKVKLGLDPLLRPS